MPTQGTSNVEVRAVPAAEVLRLALWFGLAVGLLEGLAHWGLQYTTTITNQKVPRVDHNIIWATLLVDVVLFFILGVALIPALRILRRWAWLPLAYGVLGTAGAYAMISVLGRLRESGALMLALGLGVVLARAIKRGERAAVLPRTLPALLVAAVLICGATLAGDWAQEKWQTRNLPAPPADAPNVLLIVLDTLRADHVGAYGYDRPTTPFLDEYAKDAVVFQNAFANSSWTLPSHASLFTGRLPAEHGAELDPYDGRFPTLAEVFSARGYSTVGIVANNSICTRAAGMARGFQRWKNTFVTIGDIVDRTILGRKIDFYVGRKVAVNRRPYQMDAEEVRVRFASWLEQRPARPFFAFLNFMDTHLPYLPPHEYLKRFSQTPERIASSKRYSRRRYAQQSDEIRRRDAIDAYDASLAYLDTELRRLFEDLARRGLDKNLLVVIASDHGESLGEHNLYDHRNSLYLDQVRVPLMIRGPGKLGGGRRVQSAVGLNQLAGAIMQLTGAPPDPFPAAPRPLWEESAEENAVIAELAGGQFPGVWPNWPIWNGSIKCAINRRWHFILSENGQKELYDWPADPGETRNLAGAPDLQNVIAAFEAQVAFPKRSSHQTPRDAATRTARLP